jgi:hypothetical protein
VGVGSVGDAWSFVQVFRGRLGLWDWLPLSTAPSALMMLLAVAVLVQFRIAFAAAVREAGGRARPGKNPGKPVTPNAGASGQKSAASSRP